MQEEKINWEELALTRFILASIVMVGHLKGYTEIGNLKWFTLLGSFEAILGFLLISGLSIGKSILKNEDTYFKRRVQRIYPVYAASLVFQMFVLPGTLNFGFISMIILNLLFLNQIFTAESYLGVSWTLSVEVWLYALAPVFKKTNVKILYALIFLSFLFYCFYTVGRTLFHWNYYSGTQYGLNLVTLSFIWIAGFVLALYPEKKKFTSIVVALLLLGYQSLNMLIQILYRYKHNEISSLISEDLPSFIGTTICLALVFWVVIFNGTRSKLPSPLKKLFSILGDISYPLYLTHCTCFLLLSNLGVKNRFIMIPGAIFFSYLIYFIFDFYSKRRSVKNKAELSERLAGVEK